jgi:hypothetical protein
MEWMTAAEFRLELTPPAEEKRPPPVDGWRPLENPRLRALSLGAGVQSSTLALMSAVGEVERVDCAIFADTGDEPIAVYRHLEYLESVLPFPVYRVRRPGGTLAEHMIRATATKSVRSASAPFFTKDPDGMLPRQCSKEFKVRPIVAKVRELVGLAPGQRGPSSPIVEQWIGISLDEAHRMKPAESRWIRNRYPLVERRMTRRDCLAWLDERGFPRPPKSACVYCPYHDQEGWRRTRAVPADWQKALAVDAGIRAGMRGMRGTVYVHRQLVPLDQVDLSRPEDRGQGDLFGEECEGICGV